MPNQRPVWLLPLLITAAVATACGGSPGAAPSAEPAATSGPITSTPLAPALPTPTVDASGASGSAAETATSAARASKSAQATSSAQAAAPMTSAPAAAKRLGKIYLIALSDEGKAGKAVGCGDSAVAVQVQTAGGVAVLKNSLEALLAIKDQHYGQSGLYNALYQADLQVAKATIVNGHADIRLAGRLLLGGTCDSPRVKAQLEETALQFSTVKSVSVYVNDVPLDQLISATGE